MRVLAILVALGAGARAEDLPDRIWVARIATERASFGAPSRQTILAPALPVGEGALLVVGFALDPPDDKDEAVQVTAIDPKGNVVPAQLVGGDEDLRCTLFRLTTAKPEPVALEGARVEVGAEVVLLGREGEVMRFAPRRTTMRVEAMVAAPRRLYALPAEAASWQGAVAMTTDGKLIGFVDARPTITEGQGAMLGIGTMTPVIVPAEVFLDVPRSLPRKDKARAWLGVNLAPFDEDRETYFGVPVPQEGAFVTGVAEGSPADRAGVRLHDVIQSIGDLRLKFEKMEEWAPMLQDVQRLPLGTPLLCRVVRFRALPDGHFEASPLDLTLTLEARPLDFQDATETEIEDLGLRVKPVTQDWRRSHRLPGDLDGVVVTRTEHASPSHLGGLEIGDMILKVDDQPVPSAADLKKALADAREAKRTKIVFFVRRGSATLFLTVQPGE